MPIPQDIETLLQEHKQQQLTRFWDKLSEGDQNQLLNQIREIDFPRLDQLISKAMTPADADAQDLDLKPLENSIRLPESDTDRQKWEEATERGREILQAGKVGCILVAGGQGSRLGFPHPKGMYPVGPVTDRTLFQIFFEQLLALSNRYGVRIPYFIMTSDATHAETEEFLEQHSWFGYPSEDVFLFRQGTMPAVDDATGKVLLADQAQIAMSPDGHGGLLNALKKAGLLDEMGKRGIEYLYYHQVDNPCARLCDPAMLGFHALEQAEVTTKVVAKRDSSEKVGVFGQVNGNQGIIEYSDLPEELAQQTDDQGRLTYWAGNIAIHVFNVALFERLTGQDTGLPVHIAHKKVAHLNEAGEPQKPETPNAYKFERFIFDAIPMAEKALVLETSRQEEFNPVKNAEGSDSPATSRQALNENGRQWLTEAGYDIDSGAAVEISPLIALEAEDLKGELQADQLEGQEIVLIPDSK